LGYWRSAAWQLFSVGGVEGFFVAVGRAVAVGAALCNFGVFADSGFTVNALQITESREVCYSPFD